jgi:hypothetical protein
MAKSITQLCCLVITLLLGVSCIEYVVAASPVLHFSDITSGPKTGNTDGAGGLSSSQHGAIVTVWGNFLGATQGSSKIFIRDVSGNMYESAHIYYWKNADGTLPGGPADLYSYQKMQEIAFSIPSSAADGLAGFYVEINGVSSNTLPFTIRSGNIYFVKAGGSDSNSGTWSTPWATLSFAGEGAGGRIQAGDTIYVGNGVTHNGELGIKNIDGTADKPISLLAYPNAKVTVIGDSRSAIMNWYSAIDFWNLGKIVTMAGGATGIFTFKEGRIVGMEITDASGTCADGWGGAIAGNNLDGTSAPSGIKALGNYIHDFGCASTGAGHHVFYITNRGGFAIKAYELGWNFLKDNQVNSALHIYDQSPCGDWTGSMEIHDNVVVNQRGYAFNYDGSCASQLTVPVNVYNNLFINTGIGPVVDPTYNYYAAIEVGGTETSNVNIYHNTIYGYSDPGMPDPADSSAVMINHQGTFSYRNNIVVDTKNLPFSASTKTPTSHSGNLWYNGGDGNPSALPSWDSTALTSNPLLVNPAGNDFTLQSSSSARDVGADVGISRDLFGNPRDSRPDAGAFEYGGGSTPDTTPPTRSSGSPTGTLPTGTTTTTVSLATNEAATCKYSNAANTVYASMSGTFTTTGGTSHSKSLTGLSAGTYNYYVRCQDLAGNSNADDYQINFSIASMTGVTITSVSGVVSPGSSLTISGSGFGSHSLSISWTGNNIEAGTNGNSFSMSGWGTGQAGGAPYPKYSAAMSHSGSKSIISSWPAGYTSEFFYNMGSPQNIVYWTYWTYLNHPGGNAYQFKQWRLRPNNAVGDVTGELMTSTWYNSDGSTSMSYICDFVNSVNCFDASGEYIGGLPPNSWVRNEAYWKYGASNGDFVYKGYWGGTVTSLANHIGNYQNNAINQHQYLVFENYCGNADPGNCQTSAVYYDDVYVQYGTQARIEICTESVWSSRKHCEIQIPIAWSSGSITFTANQGSFTSGSAVYLYVVDSTGTVNANGYPITFGSYSSDTIPPVCSSGSPTGTLPTGTTTTTVSLATNEAATCKYSNAANTVYASMSGTFTTTGSNSHARSLTGLSRGNYNYYVRCTDASGNANTEDYLITFSIAGPNVCGNSVCESGENCTTCSTDCGLCPVQCLPAEIAPCNGCIDAAELSTYIAQWKASTVITMKQLIDAIALWKGGCR